MKPILIVFLLSINIIGHAQSAYTYSSDDFNLNLKLKTINTDSFILTAEIQSKSNILIPVEICTLQYDTSSIYFDNSWCYPFYIKSLGMNQYIPMPKDSSITVISKQLNINDVKNFKFKFIYIRENVDFKLIEPELYYTIKNGIKTYSINSIFESKLVLSTRLLVKLKEL